MIDKSGSLGISSSTARTCIPTCFGMEPDWSSSVWHGILSPDFIKARGIAGTTEHAA